MPIFLDAPAALKSPSKMRFAEALWMPTLRAPIVRSEVIFFIVFVLVGFFQNPGLEGLNG
jgi:hypothetical protein